VLNVKRSTDKLLKEEVSKKKKTKYLGETTKIQSCRKEQTPKGLTGLTRDGTCCILFFFL
jgi:hypothetical protein